MALLSGMIFTLLNSLGRDQIFLGSHCMVYFIGDILFIDSDFGEIWTRIAHRFQLHVLLNEHYI